MAVEPIARGQCVQQRTRIPRPQAASLPLQELQLVESGHELPSSHDRAALRDALGATRGAWERAYERRPPEHAERAAVRLVSLVAERDHDAGRDADLLTGARMG
jgi:hypothetical protein